MKTILLWTIALLVTIGSAIYQRTTGPTYPLKGSINIDTENIEYKLPRSHSGNDNQIVEINSSNQNLDFQLVWKRYKTKDEWTYEKMNFKDSVFSAELPGQPPAGKLEYYIVENTTNLKFPEQGNPVIRFKGKVPSFVLITHIFAMFMGMLFSTRTGLEIFRNGQNVKRLAYWTVGFIVVGGFIMGPIMQKFAFGEYWTGFPFGFDLTDNKTLIAGIAWAITLWAIRRSNVPQRWALFSSIITLIIFMIPHSVLGSELDYNKLDKEKNRIKIEKMNNPEVKNETS